MTTIYLIRHSRGNFEKLYINTNESFQLENEKYILSVDGERKAKKMAKLEQIPLYIDEDFNERKFGVDNIKKIPQNFFIRQIEDEDYKLENGESRSEVNKRMIRGLIKIMKQNKDKKAAIVSHASSIAFLLTKWCCVEMINSKYVIKFKGKTILNGFDSPEVLKLVFNEKNKLVNIESIKK